ncbi:MAG: DedA family protein [Patescibacteria group bacterium]|jgi:membrane protein DedA with SNARE-associated domain
MSIFVTLEQLLVSWAHVVPLEVFAFIGSVVEEIVAPIPSPLVMATAGTIAKAQDRTWLYLGLIALISAVSKTLGCLFFYFFADKAEDLVSRRLGRFLGFSHKDVENIGKHFNGTRKDDLVLILLRAFPIMPSTPISVVCGFIKLNLRTYIQSTLIGAFIRSSIFLYLGYSGLEIYHSLLDGIDNAQSLMNIVIALALAGLLGFLYYKRGKGDLFEWLKRKLQK